MNYIAQIKGFWLLQQKHNLNSTDTALYFYLLEVCNSANWVNPFKRNNAKLLADLNVPRLTFFRSRRKLSKVGILSFRSENGSPNVTYRLADLEHIYRIRNEVVTANSDTGCDPGSDPGSDTLNKNSKPKQEEVVISCAHAFAFFAETRNNRLLKDRFNMDNNAMQQHFKTFYDSKIDLGDLRGKTVEEIARNFYFWLPKYLSAQQRYSKEKSCAKKKVHGRVPCSLHVA